MLYYGKSQGTTSLHHRIPHARQPSHVTWYIHVYTRCSIHAYWMVCKCIGSMLYKCIYWMLYWCTYWMLYWCMHVEFYSCNVSACVACFIHVCNLCYIYGDIGGYINTFIECYAHIASDALSKHIPYLTCYIHTYIACYIHHESCIHQIAIFWCCIHALILGYIHA